MKQAIKLRPHEAASHIAKLLAGNLIVPEDHIKAVRYALVEALVVLRVDGATDVSTRNKWRCDGDGVVSAAIVYETWTQEQAEASFLRRAPQHSPNIKAADNLASICFQAIERGHIIDRDRLQIPMLLQSIVGFAPDRQLSAATKKRPQRTSWLLKPIIIALRTLGTAASTKEILRWLEDREGWQVIGDTIQYFDEDKRADKVIKVPAFRNLITDAKEHLLK
ncbi:MAG: hypothetical protein P4L87_20450 [Formivibrio sp.]|nr:hypothetical protein [Formivibrio sp.]